MSHITYSYAFAAPHRITLCRPSASEKYIVDVSEEKIDLRIAHKTLRDTPPLTWKIQQPDVVADLTVFQGSDILHFSEWHRMEGGIPCMIACASGACLDVTVTGIATRLGLTLELSVKNKTAGTQDFTALLQNRKCWVISNQGWIDGIHTHLLLTMNDGRPDRIVAYGCCADEYPILSGNVDETAKAVPMPNAANNGFYPPHTLTSCLSLDAEESRSMYMILPFEQYWEDLVIPTADACKTAIDEAVREWTRHLGRGVRFDFSDRELIHGYQSCLADLFVMRERSQGKYWAITCGTEIYRSVNSWEPLLSDMVLDRAGYRREFEKDVYTYLDGQDASGCWAYSKGWEHECWGASFNKAKAVYLHYRLTGDMDFLQKNYDRMLRASRFHHMARQSTKNDPVEAFRGLMPRGMGDAGLMNGGDFYGVYYPANCQTVGADLYTLKVAEILGKTDDVRELTAICEEAKADLLTSMRNNIRTDGEHSFIPGIATANNSSLYGCLFSFYPCGILGADDPMVQSTLQYVQSKKISEGGLPVGTGWLSDGLWVAMALDNFAAAYLRMGLYDEAAAYLYPVLNHASRFVTYCEERGAEAGATVKTGDMQHLWTPLSVCSYILDAVCFTDGDTMHLCAGLPRDLLADGKHIAVKGLCTELGRLTMKIENRKGTMRWSVKFDRPEQNTMSVILHLRTPEGDCEIPVTLQSGFARGVVSISAN